MDKENLSSATSTFFLCSLLFLSATVNAEIVINEIMYDPTTEQGGDSLIEWIELFNTGNQPVNISGWTLSDNSATDTLACFNTTLTDCDIINASSFAIITDSDTVLYQNFSIFTNVTRLKVDDNAIGNGLSNSGDLISLRNSTSLIEAINYTDFPSITEGYTLERIDSFDANISSNWKSSLALNGTPGYRNSVTPSEHDLSVYAENISFTPSDPSPRTGVNITVAISNIGINNETNANVSIYNISGSLSTFIDSRLLNISKQSSVNFTTIWNTTNKGNFTILVAIANVSNEANLTNNNATKNITVDFRLILNEIMYNPPGEIGNDADFEWLEIYNNATYSENLTGWKLECDSTSKTLSGSLHSGNYLVFAKDRNEFYKYYSSSILTDSESCSLNNDGDTIKLIFNNSEIYHEESVTYSNSWGADGTGYTLEKIYPNTNNIASNWAESKAYAGTSGTKNNPDTQIKPSLKQTEIVYKTSSGSSGFSSSTPTQSTKENYEIISYQDAVSIGEEFTTIVKLQSDISKTFSVYSYVYDGKKLLSEGFDGSEWQTGWSANEQEVAIGPKPENVVLKNRIKLTTLPGNYKFRVRIKGEKDLTKDIIVLSKLKSNQTIFLNYSSPAAIVCKEDNGIVDVQIRGNGKMSLHIFSQDGFEIKNVTVENETIEKIQANGYAYVQVVNGNLIKDKCYVEMEKVNPKSITGRTVLPETKNILEMIYQWLNVLFNSENN